jgi:hypothetical protein
MHGVDKYRTVIIDVLQICPQPSVRIFAYRQYSSPPRLVGLDMFQSPSHHHQPVISLVVEHRTDTSSVHQVHESVPCVLRTARISPSVLSVSISIYRCTLEQNSKSYCCQLNICVNSDFEMYLFIPNFSISPPLAANPTITTLPLYLKHFSDDSTAPIA